MAKSIPIIIEPAILKYARICSGYEIHEAAKKSGIKEEKLSDLEKEKSEISLAQLRKISNLYKMPLAYFFLQEIPKDVILPKDFRIIYSSGAEGFSPPIMLAIRRARYVQSIIQELSGDEIKYDFKKISVDNDADDVASYFRSILDIPQEKKKSFNLSTALRYWKDAVEKLDIFILQQSLPREDVSAFSLADEVPHIIVLNSSESESRRVFSLFHEIGHILLHNSGVCTPDNFSRNSYDYIKIEKFCNQFAASFLVPYEEFTKHPIFQKLTKIPFEKWSSEDIRMLGNNFGVSQEVIYRRLMTVGVLDNSKYEQKRNQLLKDFEEYKKKKGRKPLKIPQYIKIISQNGQAYAAFILDSLHSSRITMADASDYLNTNSKHIFNIETHI